MPASQPAKRKKPAATPGPGRPKDLEKRAAILEAAKRLFPVHGFDGVSMDAIAAEAGVSKLTVYSHFKDKDFLFGEAVRIKCEEQLPPELFLADLKGPIRKQLRTIARAFFDLIMSDEAIGMHRMMAQARTDSSLARIFWEAGPRRVQEGFARFLQAEIAAGQLDIADPRRAASQFFCLLKGEVHSQMMFGCCDPLCTRDADAHLDATVDFFLRAYAPR
jgi:TetR/AcrR family transcriptional regulator, mexJK operon transcriptional repressor